jgi:hypothetical protein
VKGKLANGVGSRYSHTTSERGVSSIINADAHNSAASSRLNWGRPPPGACGGGGEGLWHCGALGGGGGR